MRPLEIAIVCLASLGGSGTVAAELAHAVGGRGHRVRVFAEARPPRLHAGTPFSPVPMVEHAVPAYAPYELALASELVAHCRAERLDVLHFHYAVPHATTATLVKHTLGAAAPACVVTLHGSDVTTLGAPEAYGEVLGASLRGLDAVTTPSRFLADRAAETLGVDPVVVPNFVDGAVFRPDRAERGRVDELFAGTSAALTLVHVSNFRAVKAAHALVPLMARLTRTVPGGARLVLIGEGPERARVEADALAAGVGNAMRFVAPAEDPVALAAWIAACDLFVLPSETESFGLAALEALACGVPVIARRVGGLPEVITDGVTGALASDVDALGPAIEQIVASGGRDAMGRAAAADARARFSPAAIVPAYERVYQHAHRGGG